MLWTLILISHLISFGFTHDLSKEDILTDALQKAALQVISQHNLEPSDHLPDVFVEDQTSKDADNRSRSRRHVPSFFNIPVLDNSTNFMHNYVSDTGVGNREDLIIEKIHEERLHVTLSSRAKGWRYIRFNSTDFVMAYQDFHLNVWRMTLNGDIKDRGLHIDSRQSFCFVDFRVEGRVMNTIFYMKRSKYSEVLYLAVTLETKRGYEIKEFKVTFGECKPVFSSGFYSTRPLRIGFVGSQYESALVALFDANVIKTSIKNSQKSSDESSKIIEIYTRNARGLQIFTINGFTYIAVANGLGCEIYRMNELFSHHFLSEVISVPEIIDIKAFRLGFSHFLGIATNTNNQYLHIWSGGQFNLKQILEVSGVLKWSAIFMPTCRDDVLIYFIRNRLPIQIFQWNGQQREFVLADKEVHQQLSSTYQVQPFSSAHFSYNHTGYVIQVDTQSRVHLVSIQTRLEVVPDPELMRGYKISDLMFNLKERFVFQQTYIQKLSAALKYAIRPNGNRMILNSNLIRNLTTFGGITASRIKSLTHVFWQNSRLSTNDLKIKLNFLSNIIKGVEQQIRAILLTTNDIVLKNRPAVIFGHKSFVGHNRIVFLNSTAAVIGSVGRHDLRQVMNDLYRRRKPQPLRGIKHVFNNIVVNGAIVSRLVNGIDFSRQIVATNTPQLIKSRVYYESRLPVVNHLVIKGRLNGLDVNRDLVFTTVPQVVIAPKIFTSPLIMAQTVNCQTIDGIDLKAFSRNALTSSGRQTVTDGLFFFQPLTTQHIAVTATVNYIDISAMETQLVYKNRAVWVRGKKNFILDDLHIKNNLFVNKHIDGLNLPHDVLLRQGFQIIRGLKTFNGITRFDERVIVKGFVDNLRLPQDIVTLTRPEIIGSPVVFGNGLVANANIDARRLVDGVDLSALALIALKTNDRIIASDVHFQKPVSIGFIEISGTVNGINLRQLFADAIFRTDLNVVITGTKFFGSPVQVKGMIVQTVNGFDLNDFISIHKNETISVPKVFTGFTQFKSLGVNGLVSGVNITNLYRNRISLSKPETIYGVKNFIDQLSVERGLSVTKINGLIPQSDFVLKSIEQTIRGHKTFIRPLLANKVKAKSPTIVGGYVDGINLAALNSKIIRLDEHRSYPLNIVLFQSDASFVQVFKDLNGHDIKQFADNVMSLTKPQVVFAPKVFHNGHTFAAIQSLKGISGISLSTLKANAIRLNGFSQISAPMTFSHPLVMERPLLLKGMVNGVNVSLLAADAVYKTGKQLIVGNNVFKSGFGVNGNIHAFALNGIDLSNELLTNTRDHIIRGKIKFIKSLHINGDLTLKGLINGLDLSELSKRVMRTNERNVIKGNLELMGATRVLTDMAVAGPVNGVDLKHYFNDAVFLATNQVITGAKTVTMPIAALRHFNATVVNGANVPQLLHDIVFINSPHEQLVSQLKVFANDIISHGFVQSKGMSQMGPINGVNLMRLNADSVKTDKSSVLRLERHFKDVVIISSNSTQIIGRINGIDLMKDVIHLRPLGKSPQVIAGAKAFERLVLNDNALIDGLVNGFSLKDIEGNTFFIANDQRIIGHKEVNGLMEFSADNNFVGTLNGLRIPDDLTTLNTNQTIFGHLIFKHPIVVNRNLIVSGLVSGHNLSRLGLNSLMKNRPQLLRQPIKFESVVFRGDVVVEQHINNIDLSRLSNTVKHFTVGVNVTKDILVNKAHRHHFISDYLFHTLKKSVFEIDSFSLYQSLDEVHGNHIEVLGDGVFALKESIETPRTVQSIRFNPKTELFDVSNINDNPLLIRKAFFLSGEEFTIYLSPFSHNFSAQIARSGQSIATIAPFVSSVEVLKIYENNVILVSLQSNTGKLLIHSFEIFPKNRFAFHEVTEVIVGTDTSKVVAFLNQNQVYVVVAKRLGLNCALETSGTMIFLLRNYRTLEAIQKLPLMNVIDVIHFENNGKHYLALSDDTSVDISLSPQTIYVYRSGLLSNGKCSFSLFQKLFFDNVVQLSAFTYGTIYSPNQYLVAINASEVSIWKQKGESGFAENWVLHAESARVISPFVLNSHLFLIVGQRYKCHESLVFKADSRGIALESVVFRSKESLN